MQAVADALQMKNPSVEKPQIAEHSPPPNLIKNFEDLKGNFFHNKILCTSTV